ncbi:hypothetical protein EYS09_00230 [Streptomyces kasugaensis]|uniref:Uncharacterized protein n=1 Tax=Streptomyces kasugaensis TaxID=1946 RepID=A0A4V2JJ94_STRKA|nr:hypothetical protein [Streptomyces kasugaensis]TBO61651.1 hypothetical protein EYS09_00230 [Streptomyces kasugaensis]
MSEISALWRPVPSGETAWLADLCQEDSYTGYLAPGRPDAAWVLHAMYEYEQGPGTVSRHQAHQAGLADGSIEPTVVAGIDIDATPGLVTTGGGLGRAEHPGAGWRRLRWAELARRVGEPVVAEGLLPSYRSAPDGRTADRSWPTGIEPPTEGSLDRETWNRLITILLAYAPAGANTRCLAHFSPLTMGALFVDRGHVLTGGLGDALALYDLDEPDFSPANLWPQDRSWIVCTDYDLWGTKVVGPTELIDALVGDTELEAVRLPWAG